ncbi:polysaccharide pyruvyl transferase family protein [Jeotgalibacillus aurantiacus]|uniref:polysaccharide pyruvyl transferase family protein n=1 Tax=Jeotgalibacillus aurantiacus TaxID=2763266 RepID=UPI001D0AE7C1|nr:polysaccharide pyruvyl transferase family protein [Jeotgalibacillus aurantiacus]
MKIGIVGNYGHDNNGDEAILAGILESLEEHAGINRRDVVVFSNHPHKTIEEHQVQSVPLIARKKSKIAAITATIRSHIHTIRKLDLLIIGGGGLLMDLYKRDAPVYSVPAFLAKRFGCKTVIWGVGAGPITTPLGTMLIKQMATSADIISVRDQESKELLERIGVTNPIQLATDPAFGLTWNRARVKTDQLRKIGVTAVPYYSKQYWPVHNEEKYQAYITGFARNLDRIIEEQQAEITFFATKYPQDVEVVNDIQKKMLHGNATSLVEKNMKPQDIMAFSAKQDLIIGTRLHSLILAVRTGTPVIGVGYHRKVGAFTSSINQESFYCEIDQLDELNLVHMVNEMNLNWDRHQGDILTVSEELHQKATEFPKQLKKKLIGGVELD